MDLLPNDFAPRAFAPKAFAPRAFEPSDFAPSAFEPNDFAPSALEPNDFEPNDFDPSAFEAIARVETAFCATGVALLATMACLVAARLLINDFFCMMSLPEAF